MKIDFIVSPNVFGKSGSGTIIFNPEEITDIRRFYTPSVYKMDNIISLDQFYITEYSFSVIDGELIGNASFKFRDYINRLNLL